MRWLATRINVRTARRHADAAAISNRTGDIGRIDSDDAVRSFNNYDATPVTDDAEAYDLNDSGEIDFDDGVRLFSEL